MDRLWHGWRKPFRDLLGRPCRQRPGRHTGRHPRCNANKEAKGLHRAAVLADLDSDGVLDLISTPFDGRLVVLSGASLMPLWSFAAPDVEEDPGRVRLWAILTAMATWILSIASIEGFFPYGRAAVRAFDGQTGALLWTYSVEGNLVPPSPLAVDMDADGRDEIFFVESERAIS